MIKKIISSLFTFAISFFCTFLVLHFAVYLLSLQTAWIPNIIIKSIEAFFNAQAIVWISLTIAFYSMLKELFYKTWLSKFVSISFAVAAFLLFWNYLPESMTRIKNIVDQAVMENAIEKASEQVIYEEAQIFEYEGLPTIQVLSHDSVEETWLNTVVDQAIRTQPAFMLEKCQSILLMDPEFFQAEEGYEKGSQIVGLASSADMTVKIMIQDFEANYIDSSMPEIVMEPIDYYRNTLCHELSHLIDYQEQYSQSFLSDDPDFQQLYKDYQYSINDYAATSLHEYFAESSKLYLRYPQYLINKNYSVFEYFQNLYRPYGY